MKKKLLSTILSLALVFSFNQMTLVSANDDVSAVAVVVDAGVNPIDGNDEYGGVDNNMSEQGGPSTMLPDANEVPSTDYDVDNDMSEQGGPSTMLPDANEVPDIDYGVNNDMSEQGGTPIPNDNEAIPFPETSEQKPSSVPSTGVTLLNRLF